MAMFKFVSLRLMIALTYHYTRKCIYTYNYRQLPVEILCALIDCISAAPLNCGDERSEDLLGKHTCCEFVCKCIMSFILSSFLSPISCILYARIQT